jgi:hypothetical protein
LSGQAGTYGWESDVYGLVAIAPLQTSVYQSSYFLYADVSVGSARMYMSVQLYSPHSPIDDNHLPHAFGERLGIDRLVTYGYMTFQIADSGANNGSAWSLSTPITVNVRRVPMPPAAMLLLGLAFLRSRRRYA